MSFFPPPWEKYSYVMLLTLFIHLSIYAHTTLLQRYGSYELEYGHGCIFYSFIYLHIYNAVHHMDLDMNTDVYLLLPFHGLHIYMHIYFL